MDSKRKKASGKFSFPPFIYSCIAYLHHKEAGTDFTFVVSSFFLKKNKLSPA